MVFLMTAAASPANAFDFKEINNPLIEVFLIISFLSFLPALLIMVTSFTRIVVVLSFLRSAFGGQHVPPNPVIIGLSLFLTFFVMSPTINVINEKAVTPYIDDQVSFGEAVDQAVDPLKEFMLKQTRQKDIALFAGLSKKPVPASPAELSMNVLVPAFAISELKTAFEIGFLLFLPFLIVDMVVASILLSMGMMMLPPVMISLPFKLLLFVLVDGWNLIVGSMMRSF
jgi:flagellar biosynthetic protein FliP